MSSNAPKTATWPSTLGLVLVIITAVLLLGSLGVFGVGLLASMLNNPQQAQPVATAPPTSPAGPVDAAAQLPGAVPATPVLAGAAPNADPALAALMEKGKQTYMLCAACHGMEGKAVVANMAPNLAGSAYVNGPTERLSMLVLNGIQYPGKYLGQMIAWKATLTDEDIAGVLSYIRNEFGNAAPAITPDMIKAAREKHGSRDTPFSRAELDQVTTDLP